MKISIGADHRGYVLKKMIIDYFRQHEFLDVGTFSQDRTDYPLFAKKVCKDIFEGKAPVGILICGSGVGMSIAANRYKKIYAALCWSLAVVRQAKAHDKANVLVVPADFVTEQLAYDMITAWLEEPFKEGVYAERLLLIDQ